MFECERSPVSAQTCTRGSLRASLAVILSVGNVGGNFRSSTDTSGPKGGALVSAKRDCTEERGVSQPESVKLKG